MNDFTKEELKKILKSLKKTHDVYDFKTMTWADDLAFKVALMIDNYCEHKK